MLVRSILTKGNKGLSFTSLVKLVIKELEGAFAVIFKSKHYPNEIVAARRGSPLLIGVKTAQNLKVDFVDVEFGGDVNPDKGTLTLTSRRKCIVARY